MLAKNTYIWQISQNRKNNKSNKNQDLGREEAKKDPKCPQISQK